METLIENIKQWGIDRGIVTNSTPQAQAVKTLEEVAELFDAILKEDEYEIKDAIGDIIVTLVMVAGTAEIDIKDCIEQAYNEIKDRKGYLRSDGIFVKEN
jgi:NTP pyrophosphatase (non-canonical NTP hydrolase)